MPSVAVRVVAVPSAFRLRTFGSPQLRGPDGEPVRFRTRKHLALLIRLAIESGRPLTRDYLIDLLWGDAPMRQARHSLAQGISVLRTRLGRGHVITQKATVALDDVVEVDACRLAAGDGEIAGLFLDGFEVPQARAFEDWKDSMRARLFPRMRDCLVAQMDASRRIGDFATVERHAQVLLDLDPHSEDAVRGLMEARAWVGDRSSALKVYARFEARLEEELGARPSAPLARVAHLLREGRPAARPPDPDEPAPKPEKPFRAEHLVAREREFSVLYDAWLAVRRREPRIVVVTGDPGVGKTTLTNAFAATCQMEGAVVVRAQAYDGSRDLPFAVLSDLVRQLTEQRAIGSADPEALSELTRVCAEIVHAFPGVPKPGDWSADILPLRLAQAFWRTLEAASEESPLLVVVDDIHAADNASTAILHLVARKLAHARLLVVLTGRPSEIRATPASAALVSDAVIGATRTLELEPLLPPDAERLLRELIARGDTPLPDSAAVRILRASSGNPLALALLAREWQSPSGATLIADLDRLNTQPAATIGIPRAIRTVFERQRQRLPAEVGAALDVAALLGRRLAELEFYEVAGLTAGGAAEALARLREEGIFREVQGALEFRNELIRAQAYYAVPAPPRRQLHRRVAELLRPRAEAGGEALLLETAWHFLRGGDDERGRSYGMRGAEAALAAGAPHETEQMLEVLVGTFSDEAARRKAQLLLSESLVSQSKAGKARALLSELRGDSSLSARDLAAVTLLQATTEYLIGVDGGSEYAEIAHEALAAASAAGTHPRTAEALFEYARSGVETGQADRIRGALNRVDEALQADRQLGVSAIHYTRAFCLFHLGDVAGTAQALQLALDFLRTHPNPVEESRVLTGLAICQQLTCDTLAALNTGARALSLARQIGDSSRCSVITGNLASIHLTRGEFTEALTLGQRSLDLAAECLVQPFLLSTYTTLAFAHAMLGHRREAEDLFAQGTTWSGKGRRWRIRLQHALEAAEFQLLSGHLGSALSHFDDAERLYRDGLVPFESHYQPLKTLWLYHSGDGDKALQFIRRETEKLRDRIPFTYLTAVAARAWLEKKMLGELSEEATEGLKDERWSSIAGRLRLLEAQGFALGR